MNGPIEDFAAVLSVLGTATTTYALYRALQLWRDLAGHDPRRERRINAEDTEALVGVALRRVRQQASLRSSSKSITKLRCVVTRSRF
jgi:hypothetical protein